MTTQLERLKGRALMRSKYRCRCCGVERWGTGFEIPVDANSLQEIEAQVNGIRVNARDMPVGWASYAGAYECEACEQKAG
jgi:hypothetical protein